MKKQQYSPPPAKEAMVIVLDVGKSMGTGGAIDDAKKAVTLLIKQKVLKEKQFY